MKQISHWSSVNVRRHRTKFDCQVALASVICLPLVLGWVLLEMGYCLQCLTVTGAVVWDLATNYGFVCCCVRLGHKLRFVCFCVRLGHKLRFCVLLCETWPQITVCVLLCETWSVFTDSVFYLAVDNLAVSTCLLCLNVALFTVCFYLAIFYPLVSLSSSDIQLCVTYTSLISELCRKHTYWFQHNEMYTIKVHMHDLALFTSCIWLSNSFIKPTNAHLI